MNDNAATITPDQAAWRLAAAHRDMTPENIAAHAQALANVVASQEQFIANLMEGQAATVAAFNNLASLLHNIGGLSDTLAACMNSGRLMVATGLANEIAGILKTLSAVKPLALPDRRPPVVELWPEIYEPKDIAR